MEIPIGAEVQCSDGACGHSTFVILNPINEQVTHFVVAENGLIPEDHLVPVDLIVESTAREIRLRCTKAELRKMEIFTRLHFRESANPGLSTLYWPYFDVPDGMPMTEVEEHIPPGELAVRRGASVEATDGHIGQVEGFLINPSNGYISHLVLREGHLWGRKDVTIPVSQIDHMEEDTVYLKLDKHSIEALPAISVKR